MVPQQKVAPQKKVGTTKTTAPVVVAKVRRFGYDPNKRATVLLDDPNKVEEIFDQPLTVMSVRHQ
jgi:hypothetical protein